MEYPFKDYDFIGDKYVNIKDKKNEFGEILFFERKDTNETECLICKEAENEMFTKYAHPKAHSEANLKANVIAEELAIKYKTTDDYLDYYIFFYGREYKKIYSDLYKKYKEEYSEKLMKKTYDYGQICPYHNDSLMYNDELRNK